VINLPSRLPPARGQGRVSGLEVGLSRTRAHPPALSRKRKGELC